MLILLLRAPCPSPQSISFHVQFTSRDDQLFPLVYHHASESLHVPFPVHPPPLPHPYSSL